MLCEARPDKAALSKLVVVGAHYDISTRSLDTLPGDGTLGFKVELTAECPCCEAADRRGQAARMRLADRDPSERESP